MRLWDSTTESSLESPTSPRYGLPKTLTFRFVIVTGNKKPRMPTKAISGV